MAETSTMLALGTKLPSFRLLNTYNQQYVSSEQLGTPLAIIVAFICNHCPYVKHIQNKFIEVAKMYQAKGMKFVAISSNDIETYPEDGPAAMKKEAETFGYPFPYLFDETQEVAKKFHAVCTPEFYVFDKSGTCVYHGRFDAATPRNQEPVTGQDLCRALDGILTGKGVDAEQQPSIGCSIKWRS